MEKKICTYVIIIIMDETERFRKLLIASLKSCASVEKKASMNSSILYSIQVCFSHINLGAQAKVHE